MSRAGRPSERHRQQAARLTSLVHAAHARVVKAERGSQCECRPSNIVCVPVGLEVVELRCATCYAMLDRAFYAGKAQRDRALAEITEAQAIESDLPAGSLRRVGSAVR